MGVEGLATLVPRDPPVDTPESSNEVRHYHAGPGAFDAICKTNEAIFMTDIWSRVTCEECLKRRVR